MSQPKYHPHFEGPAKGVVIGDHAHVTQHFHGGMSEDRVQQLTEELGVTKAALKNFFIILDEHRVPPEDLDSTLRQIAKRHTALREQLQHFTSDDPRATDLKRQTAEALDAGDFAKAERLLNQASDHDLQAAQELEALAHRRRLSAAAAKKENGDLLYTQLRYADAAHYYRAASEVVPSGEETVLADYLTLAGLSLIDARQYAEAEDSIRRALALRERVLGSEHPDVAASCNNLAALYRAQGRYEAAEPLYQRALALRERVLGPEHPNVAQSCNNLAALYEAQGRYEAAEPLHQRALALCERVLGPEHPDVATSCNNLAALYRVQGRYEVAEPLYQRALALRERVLGPEHPEVATVIKNYSALLHDMRQFKMPSHKKKAPPKKKLQTKKRNSP